MDPTIRFTELVQGPEDALALDEAALLIAAHAHPGLDLDLQLAKVDALAGGVDDRTLEAWRRRLFVELGFSGNVHRYYDPANSFLDDVMRRRKGLPITLSVLGMEVGRRVGLRLEGVGMPGHFLLRHGPDAYVDPFDGGRLMDRDQCVERFRALHGPNARFRSQYLNPVGPLAILSRILNNLKSVYVGRSDVAALSWVFDLRMALPGASPLERREWARVLGASGRFLEAATQMEELIDLVPAQEDALRTEAAGFRARLN
ncbi:MAG TPA: transglutaminase-like domain-containing protein [Acidimicrobiales bacterium]|jgi:regulator of sirC expression with transglutaminase-like and TPR domain|nr:transglutaminase-like domain-containing protein [Acidimicrobiales bacterium]